MRTSFMKLSTERGVVDFPHKASKAQRATSGAISLLVPSQRTLKAEKILALLLPYISANSVLDLKESQKILGRNGKGGSQAGV
ncbi:hypothetical protein DV515_00013222 [Chloebia gouldiae]|uniref:Uncharacterized protein n=1 Tax=Chloebia gouldiae TaxID=44316 RepID=A0A3L8S1X7_CHLGU|nr:hypothetical protein DV515_00013222 [Chloebia gouldiae]